MFCNPDVTLHKLLYPPLGLLKTCAQRINMESKHALYLIISTLNFPSAENDTNLFIESFTLLCGFEFASRNILTFKLHFCVQIYFCVLCDS